MQTAPIPKADAKPLTIGVARTSLWGEAPADVRKAVETAASTLSSNGANVVDIEWPELFDQVFQAFQAHQTIHDYECCRANAWEMDVHGELISPLLMETLHAGLCVTREHYTAALATARSARTAFAGIQAGIDASLTPSATSATPQRFKARVHPFFNRFLTLMGVPCINLPGYLSSQDLPIGIQLVGRMGQDDTLLTHADMIWEPL